MNLKLFQFKGVFINRNVAVDFCVCTLYDQIQVYAFLMNLRPFEKINGLVGVLSLKYCLFFTWPRTYAHGRTHSNAKHSLFVRECRYSAHCDNTMHLLGYLLLFLQCNSDVKICVMHFVRGPSCKNGTILLALVVNFFGLDLCRFKFGVLIWIWLQFNGLKYDKSPLT